jgi:NADP-dependent 3-hydroxy acid dehydrogenase YdfG
VLEALRPEDVADAVFYVTRQRHRALLTEACA